MYNRAAHDKDRTITVGLDHNGSLLAVQFSNRTEAGCCGEVWQAIPVNLDRKFIVELVFFSFNLL